MKVKTLNPAIPAAVLTATARASNPDGATRRHSLSKIGALAQFAPAIVSEPSIVRTGAIIRIVRLYFMTATAAAQPLFVQRLKLCLLFGREMCSMLGRYSKPLATFTDHRP
jgi:hypothetical protein